jgi:hypothetical protein
MQLVYVNYTYLEHLSHMYRFKSANAIYSAMDSNLDLEV